MCINMGHIYVFPCSITGGRPKRNETPIAINIPETQTLISSLEMLILELGWEIRTYTRGDWSILQ